jgi:hypothetical protein
MHQYNLVQRWQHVVHDAAHILHAQVARASLVKVPAQHNRQQQQTRAKSVCSADTTGGLDYKHSIWPCEALKSHDSSQALLGAAGSQTLHHAAGSQPPGDNPALL